MQLDDDDDDDDNVAPPEGVRLRAPDDTDGLREDIESGVMNAMQKYVNGYEYGGTRLELSNMAYADKPRYSLAEQREALLKDSTMARRLRGTVTLVDVETNKPLEVRKNMTLARVPYLTQRGTMIHNGSEYACFHGTTKIWTEKGLLPISKIVGAKLDIKVWSWDFTSQQLVLKRVTNWFTRKITSPLGRLSMDAPKGMHPELLQGKTNFSTVWCTPDHQIYAADGSKLPASKAPAVSMISSRMTAAQRQLLIGTMLGDGTIQAPGTYRVSQCAAQKGYVDLKREILKPYLAEGTVTRDSIGKSIVPQARKRGETLPKLYPKATFSTCNFDEMARWREVIYPDGVRNLDRDWFEEGEAPALAFWFCDDGSARYQRNGSNCPAVTLHTNNFTVAEVVKLRDWLMAKWGLNSCVTPKYGKQCQSPRDRMLVLGGEDAWRFLELVAPYVPDCLSYKLLPRPLSLLCGCGASVAPSRKVCTPCYHADIRATSGPLSKSIRVRFGNSANARLAAVAEAPADDDYIYTRWSRIQETQGKGLASLLADTAPAHVLRELEVVYSLVPSAQYSKVRQVYDLEVEDTHNYFANGILVSNCVSQSRLLPGAYTRKTNSGVLECFHRDTQIWTELGMLPIGRIVNEKLDIRVWSYDFERGEFELKRVVNWYRNKVKSGLGRLRYDANGRCPNTFPHHGRGTIWVTPDHKFMEADGGKRPVADTRRPLLVVEEKFTADQEQVVLGSLLGDGYIAPNGIFQESHSLAQSGYLQWKREVLGSFVARDVNAQRASSGFGGAPYVASIHTKSTAYFRRLRRDFYGENGVKILSHGLLDRIDARGLAVWFGDDGCSFLASTSTHASTSCYVVNLATNGFDGTSVEYLVDWLQRRWGIKFSARKVDDKRRAEDAPEQWALWAYGDHAERFLAVIAPYLHPSLAGKLPDRPPVGVCKSCGLEQDRRRRTCNACWIARFVADPTIDTAALRRRFGSMASIRCIAGGGAMPADLNPGLRWDALMSSLGRALPAAPAAVTYTFCEVGYEYEENHGRVLERTSFAYDLEVEDTHNYVANGVLVSNCHFNVRPGSGSAMRMTLDPTDGTYRLKVGTSNVHAYSVFKDLGVTDDELEKRWGPEILEVNRKGYDSRAVDRVYMKAIPKWQRDASLPKADKARNVVEAFSRAQVAGTVLRDNLPNLYNREKAASWRLQGLAMEKLGAAQISGKSTPRAVIVKGNPHYVEGNPKADAFYKELADLVRSNGYEPSFDAGEPNTSPDESAALWVGHSRGQDRLRFAPKGVKTLAVDQFEHRAKERREENAKLMEAAGYKSWAEWPVETRPAPADEHYQVTDDLRRALAELAVARPAPEVEDAPVRRPNLVEATHALLKKSAASAPVKFKPTTAPATHHRYLADDDEHEAYESIGIDGLLAASEKLLAVNRGIERVDQRDIASNDRVYTVDRLMAERVKLDHGKTLRTLMGRLSRRKNLSALGPAAFDPYTVDYLKGNPLATAIEEINPMNIMEQRRRITKMGPGGIGDPNAITIGMQSVDSSQFGFVSPSEGPESERAGIDVRLSYGARVGSDGRIYQIMRNMKTGKKQWVSPSDVKGKTVKLPD